MLQDDDDDQIICVLGLNAGDNFYLIATEEDFKDTIVEQEDEDIVKVKVEFVHNRTNDDHFDLTDKRKILGNILYKKFGRICNALQKIIDNHQLQFDETIAKFLEKELDEYVYNPAESKERLSQSPYRRLELIPEAARDIIKKKLLPKLHEKNKIVPLDVKQFVEKNLIENE